MKNLLRSALLFLPLATWAEGSKAPFVSWGLENCSIAASKSYLRLQTSGTPVEERLDFRVVSSIPLKKPPHIHLNNDEHNVLEVDGYGRFFNFSMEYNALSVSRLLDSGASFVFAIDPIYAEEDGRTYSYNIAIPTADLPVAIAKKLATPACG